jgi:hypothetical protein
MIRNFSFSILMWWMVLLNKCISHVGLTFHKKNLNNKTYHVTKRLCATTTPILCPKHQLFSYIQNIYIIEFTWKKNNAKTSYIAFQIMLNKCKMEGNYFCFRLASWGAYMQFFYVFWHIKVCNDPWPWNNFVVVLFAINLGEMAYFLYFLRWKGFMTYHFITYH